MLVSVEGVKIWLRLGYRLTLSSVWKPGVLNLWSAHFWRAVDMRSALKPDVLNLWRSVCLWRVVAMQGLRVSMRKDVEWRCAGVSTWGGVGLLRGGGISVVGVRDVGLLRGVGGVMWRSIGLSVLMESTSWNINGNSRGKGEGRWGGVSITMVSLSIPG